MARRVTVASLGRLPARARDGHKGTFGTVTVVGGCCRGSVRYVGAPALSALGALRSGCGLCRVLAPEPIVQTVLGVVASATGVALPVGRDGGLVGAAGLKELEYAAGASRAVVLGPGLGDGAGVSALVRRAWRGLGVPLVLDADGLNRLSDARLGPARGQAVVTPHPGEARRLMERYGVEGDPTSARERERVAAELATAMECVAVLKGARTVVSDGTRVYVNTSGGPVLATGGTGDVLAGVIGGLIAQGANPFTAACLGVLAHGRAGDAWARERRAPGGMLAAELAGQIAREVERLRG